MRRSPVLVWTRSSSARPSACVFYPGGKSSSPGDLTWERAVCSMHFAVFRASSLTPRRERRVMSIAFRTALGGWPVDLTDTAGLRATDHAIELLGIERAKRELADADLVLLVLDRSESLRPIDRQLMATITNAAPGREQGGSAASVDRRRHRLAPRTAVTISAERGDGMDALAESMIERLVPAAPIPAKLFPSVPGTSRSWPQRGMSSVAGNISWAARELESLIGSRGE